MPVSAGASHSRRLLARLCPTTLLALVGLCVAALPSRSQQADPPLTSDDSALVSQERAMWHALESQDTASFSRLMGNGVIDVDVSGARRTTPASVARFVTSCQTAKTALSNVRVTHGPNTSVVTYRAAVEQTCWGQKAPSALNVMTVYERRSGAWVPIAHSETPASE